MKGKKKMMLILGLLAAVLLLTAVFLLMSENSSDTEQQTETVEGQMVEVVDLGDAQPELIEVVNEQGSYQIIRTEQGLLTVDAAEGYPLVQSLLETAVAGFSSIDGEIVYEKDYDPAKFGLDDPAAKLRIQSGETEQILYLGDYNEGAKSWYAKTEDAERLYTISSRTGEWMLHSAYYYVDPALIPTFDASKDNLLERLTMIRIERPDLEEPLEIVADEEEANDYTSSYWITSPVHVKTSLKVMNNQIGNLLGFCADNVVGKCTESDRDVYGLDEPAMMMTVAHDGITEVFTVGDKTPDGGRYLMTSENDLLYEISENKLEFLDVTADDLFFEMALLPDINQVTSVILEFGEESYTFELDHGKTDDSLMVTIDGQLLEEKLFRNFYSFLLEIDIENINTEIPSGDSVMCVTYQYEDGTRETVESFSMEKARRMSISVNGEPSFEGRIAYVDKLKTELQHLLNGQQIDTNW